MGGSQPGGEVGRGPQGGGNPAVTHTPKLHGLWGLETGAPNEVPRPGGTSPPPPQAFVLGWPRPGARGLERVLG